MAQEELLAVKAAAIDGRGRNVFYRKTQLEKLHQALVTESAKLEAALVLDTGCMAVEAKVEFSLTLQALRDRYTELQAVKELDREYRTARAQDAADAREPYGIAVLQAARYTPLFSVVAPLAAALAAGNCVILQLEHTTRHVLDMLKRIVKSALDPDSFAITSTSIQDKDILAMSVLYIQNSTSAYAGAGNQLLSCPKLPTVAIVDRSANYHQAARSLLRARFGFQGKSPYGPDIVLVNEFTRKDLLKALVKAAIEFGDVVDKDTISAQNFSTRKANFNADIQRLRAVHGDNIRVVTQSVCGAIIEIQHRSLEMITSKITGPVLVIHNITSLDDAIDFLTNNTQYLAAYHFGRFEAGNYLVQNVPAQVSFVNHIPLDILVGPAAPFGHPLVPGQLFPSRLFSKPSAVYAVQNRQSILVGRAFDTTSSIGDVSQVVQHLYGNAVKALPRERRRKQITTRFGFFEHAFLIHFGLGLLTIVSLFASGVWWLRKEC